MASNYRLVQVLLALIFFEIIGCIPRDDLLDDDVAVVSIMASALLPTLWSAPGQEDQGLQAKVNEVLAALESS
ncbi:MAG: hypothetical protein CO095_15430 [Armatimonadetes bacterium CG_4_9_14_3_um_filter_58_7]|nr:MAG: hypothetical protein CO095_15430 [Armatimonadetes bacterium CG_4_9_14_3_um_filter_58_7]